MVQALNDYVNNLNASVWFRYDWEFFT